MHGAEPIDLDSAKTLQFSVISGRGNLAAGNVVANESAGLKTESVGLDYAGVVTHKLCYSTSIFLYMYLAYKYKSIGRI